MVETGLHFAHEHLFKIKPDPFGTNLKVSLIVKIFLYKIALDPLSC